MNHALFPDRLYETPVCKLQPGSTYLLFEASTSRCHPPPLNGRQTFALPHYFPPPLCLTGIVVATTQSSPLLLCCTMCGQP